MVNLSEGRILVRTGAAMEEGTKVRVKLDLEKFDDHLISEGEVRWCGQSARGKNDYFVGIQFKTLAEKDRKRIVQMRAWFTSPEYRVKTRRRVRQAGS